MVDENTIFATFVCKKSTIPEVPLYPRPIMGWMADVYGDAFHKELGFMLQENGGNLTTSLGK